MAENDTTGRPTVAECIDWLKRITGDDSSWDAEDQMFQDTIIDLLNKVRTEEIQSGDIMLGPNGQRYRMVTPIIDDGVPDICHSDEHDGIPIQMWWVDRLDQGGRRTFLCPHGLSREVRP